MNAFEGDPSDWPGVYCPRCLGFIKPGARWAAVDGKVIHDACAEDGERPSADAIEDHFEQWFGDFLMGDI